MVNCFDDGCYVTDFDIHVKEGKQVKEDLIKLCKRAPYVFGFDDYCDSDIENFINQKNMSAKKMLKEAFWGSKKSKKQKGFLQLTEYPNDLGDYSEIFYTTIAPYVLDGGHITFWDGDICEYFQLVFENKKLYKIKGETVFDRNKKKEVKC